jgi:hypothetical protein
MKQDPFTDSYQSIVPYSGAGTKRQPRASQAQQFQGQNGVLAEKSRPLEEQRVSANIPFG